MSAGSSDVCLPSTLDEPTQELIRDRLEIVEKTELTEADKKRLDELNELLSKRNYSVVDRDPDYGEYLRAKKEVGTSFQEAEKPSTPKQIALRQKKARDIVEKLLKERQSDEA